MGAEENAAIIRPGYEAFNSGDNRDFYAWDEFWS